MIKIENLSNTLVLDKGEKLRVSGTISKGVDVDKTLENFLGINNINFLKNDYVLNHMRSEDGTPLVESGEIVRIVYLVQEEQIYAVPTFAFQNAIGLTEVINFDKKKKITETPVTVDPASINFEELIKAVKILELSDDKNVLSLVGFAKKFMNTAKSQGVVLKNTPESSEPEDLTKAVFETIKAVSVFYKNSRDMMNEEKWFEKVLDLAKTVNLDTYPRLHHFSKSLVCTILKEFEKIEEYDNPEFLKTVLNDCYVLAKRAKNTEPFAEYLKSQTFSCEFEKELATDIVKAFETIYTL